jgi:hypothetical protein
MLAAPDFTASAVYMYRCCKNKEREETVQILTVFLEDTDIVINN